MQTTIGQLLVNEALPDEYKDYTRVLDKKAIKNLLSKLAASHPEKYPVILKALSDIGWKTAVRSGGYSISTANLKTAEKAKEHRKVFRKQADAIYRNQNLTQKQKDNAIVELAIETGDKLRDDIYKELTEAENPAAMQVLSGAKGNKFSLSAVLGMDMLYTNADNSPIPFPILKNYSEGLDPLEYWAGAYGTRRGLIDVKLATRDAGYLAKQLVQIAHRGVVTAHDADSPPSFLQGLPATTDDNGNIGRLLAHDVGGYKRNTIITDRVLHDLDKKGIKDILVRSPIIGGPWDGSLYAADVGMTDKGRLPVVGENPAVTAVQSMSEPLSQGAISSKHTGGVYGAFAAKAVTGFKTINQLIQVPKVYSGGAAHARKDGTVQTIEKAPAGGYYVYIDNEKHFVPNDQELKVKEGGAVEAGDILSDGLPNPAEVVRYKGIGEGRRYFADVMYDACKNAGTPTTRRNVEMLARGLVNHVKLNKEYNEWLPDETIPYGMLEHGYQPREGSAKLKPEYAKNQYLEQPVLHYTIGTKIRPSVVAMLQKYGVKEITAHKEPPIFDTEMIRGQSILQHDPDWLVRMYGSGQKRGVLDAVHLARSTNPYGTSFVPALITGVDFEKKINGLPVSKVTTPRHDLPPEKKAPRLDYDIENLDDFK